jgi:hypothetical protein
MPDIRMTLGSKITEVDLLQLRNNLKDLGPGDEISIRLEAEDAHQADKITDELARQGVDYQPRGDDGHRYFIIGKKK